MPQPTDLNSPTRWHFTAAVAAWLFPGLGHYLLGQRKRGIVLAVAIGLMWLVGLFIGGVATFNVSNMPESIVQLGQVTLGPSWIGYWAHGRLAGQAAGAPTADLDAQPFVPSFGRTNEQGVLYTGIAGMLNLLAIIDVLYRDPKDPRYRLAEATDDALPGEAA